MALAILDGTQTATTLSTILSSGQHITAHTVVSLGTQAITDILNATSAGLTNAQLRASSVTIVGSVFVSQPPISTARLGVNFVDSSGTGNYGTDGSPLNISGTIDIGSALPVGTNRIGVVTIGAGTVTIGAGTAQIGSVTASGTVTANVAGNLNNTIEFYDETSAEYVVGVHIKDSGNNILGQGGTPLAISGTVTANTFAIQGTAVTTSDFTSITASTVLANYNATREVLSIFNEGAGNLHICAGATCTTIAYQVRLSAGDYYEVPNHQTTITHSAVFATAGTARVTQVS